MADWKDLVQRAAGKRMVVERVRLPDLDMSIEGAFEPPPLAQLSFEDQVFVSAFIQAHGSIKEMERLFGVSYPTIKNRLNKIASRLGVAVEAEAKPSRGEILDRLERGEISPQEAVEALKK